ncbi:hypothetical protein Poly30_20400 [Planctomycetes bacterium Poly30]|uniref:Prepilin-type N-terminal cleavage/methylation domain-containing protein n=1 Tax=Saltatorellus ferox TaxID=2528018 RepID=A0A518ER07_9BACT|nr:hypothetical protein Poly30_20400 [Planctomycetes bacterium Poly30]
MKLIRSSSRVRCPAYGHRPPTKSRAGLTIVELVIAAGIMAVLLLASAGAMGESVDSTKLSRNLTQGALFLESVQEDLTAVASSDLLSMNGQQIFATEPRADAKYRVDITTFMASIDLVQIRLALIDQSTGRRVATVNSLRAIG